MSLNTAALHCFEDMKPTEALYVPLSQDAVSGGIDGGAEQAVSHAQRHKSFFLRNGTTIVLALSNLFLLFLYLDHRETEPFPTGYGISSFYAHCQLPRLTHLSARIDPLPTKWTHFDWWTEYSAKNATEVDALWDAILPSHGFVAMDNEWAAERRWPESMRLPSDESKQVYLLEAYHQLHCIVGDLIRMATEPLLKSESRESFARLFGSWSRGSR